MISSIKKLAIADLFINKKSYLLTVLIVILITFLSHYYFQSNVDKITLVFSSQNLTTTHYKGNEISINEFEEIIKKETILQGTLVNGFFLCILGYIATACLFKDYHNKGLSSFNMMLPVSKSNKFLYLMFKLITINLFLLLILFLSDWTWCLIIGVKSSLITYMDKLWSLLPVFSMIYLFIGVTFKRRHIIYGTLAIFFVWILPIILYDIIGISNNIMDIYGDIMTYMAIPLLYFTWVKFRNLQLK